MNIQIIASGSTKKQYWKKEWGLSILIDGDVLFDTFCCSDFLKANIIKYNVDIGKIKHIVISHEHWDHTGGLWWILERTEGIKVYVCSKFSLNFINKVKRYKCSLIEVSKPIPIKENIFTTGEIDGVYNFYPIHEQSLIIRQEDKIALITGCSHPGILKILSLIGLEKEMDLLLGGLHLMNKSIEEIEEIINKLDSIYGIKTLAPFHCTGDKAIEYLKNNIPQKWVKISAGDSFKFNTERSSWELIKRGNAYANL